MISLVGGLHHPSSFYLFAILVSSVLIVTAMFATAKQITPKAIVLHYLLGIRAISGCLLSYLCPFFFWHPQSNLLDGRETLPSKVYQKFAHRLNSYNSLRHFAHPSPKFYRGRHKVRNFASILDPSRLWRIVARHQESSTLSDDDWTSSWIRHFANASRIFFRGGGSNSAKFGLILAFEALQFRNKATMYLTPNSDLGNIDDGSMSSQNLV